MTPEVVLATKKNSRSGREERREVTSGVEGKVCTCEGGREGGREGEGRREEGGRDEEGGRKGEGGEEERKGEERKGEEGGREKSTHQFPKLHASSLFVLHIQAVLTSPLPRLREGNTL